MTDWKAIILGSLVTAALTMALGLAVFPLFILGPLIGGFVTVYLVSEGRIEGAIQGALSGVIGGLIIGLLSLFGLGIVTAFISILSNSIGNMVGFVSLLVGSLFTLVLIIISGVLGAVGGIIAESTIEK
ncbi:DUF5518 domain-containing protein [Methanobacterium alcaliphilum]|uniref:DUF5518 domain-containing protein n=1 Tax=Methanobacterium alcaliphilum TaxID=392018 RepID=UPI00200B0161|nr:DUF5518 domain-containing protein [Methanobacterium alcaliphilum]MCK9152614.1 DUF5518 domain-containing protein [Methanobacterium alcaliphilum]